MFASVFKIFLMLLALSFNVYAFVDIPPKEAVSMFGGFGDFDGYKNIKFGMDTNTVHSLITTTANTTEYEIYAELIDTMFLTESSEALKYYDPQYKLVYIFFFELSQLYRIDIATYAGGYLNNLDVENPVSLASIKNIVEAINIGYGRFDKYTREYKDYNGSDFVRDIYLWNSSLSSISLVVSPTIDTFDKDYKYYMYRLTYYNDRLISKLRSNK